jgi:cell division protein FtsQ
VAEERRRADAVAVPVADVAGVPRARAPRRRQLPSGRSVVVGLLLVMLGGGAYLFARESSAFALRTVEVEGAPAPLAAEIRTTLAPLVGRSLVTLDREEVMRRVRALPEVAAVGIDRAFPHALRVTVQVERSVAVLRQADRAWLLGADDRVLRRLEVRPYPPLPRIWVPHDVNVLPGSTLSGDTAETVQVAAALATGRFRLGVRTIVVRDGGLTIGLRSGVEVRLGDPGDLRLKLAVAARIVPLAPGAHYVDVTVPERAVAAYKSQAGG